MERPSTQAPFGGCSFPQVHLKFFTPCFLLPKIFMQIPLTASANEHPVILKGAILLQAAACPLPTFTSDVGTCHISRPSSSRDVKRRSLKRGPTVCLGRLASFHLVKSGLGVIVGILEIRLEPPMGDVHHDRVLLRLCLSRGELCASGRPLRRVPQKPLRFAFIDCSGAEGSLLQIVWYNVCEAPGSMSVSNLTLPSET